MSDDDNDDNCDADDDDEWNAEYDDNNTDDDESSNNANNQTVNPSLTDRWTVDKTRQDKTRTLIIIESDCGISPWQVFYFE